MSEALINLIAETASNSHPHRSLHIRWLFKLLEVDGSIAGDNQAAFVDLAARVLKSTDKPVDIAPLLPFLKACCVAPTASNRQAAIELLPAAIKSSCQDSFVTMVEHFCQLISNKTISHELLCCLADRLLVAEQAAVIKMCLNSLMTSAPIIRLPANVVMPMINMNGVISATTDSESADRARLLKKLDRLRQLFPWAEVPDCSDSKLTTRELNNIYGKHHQTIRDTFKHKYAVIKSQYDHNEPPNLNVESLEVINDHYNNTVKLITGYRSNKNCCSVKTCPVTGCATSCQSAVNCPLTKPAGRRRYGCPRTKCDNGKCDNGKCDDSNSDSNTIMSDMLQGVTRFAIPYLLRCSSEPTTTTAAAVATNTARSACPGRKCGGTRTPYPTGKSVDEVRDTVSTVNMHLRKVGLWLSIPRLQDDRPVTQAPEMTANFNKMMTHVQLHVVDKAAYQAVDIGRYIESVLQLLTGSNKQTTVDKVFGSFIDCCISLPLRPLVNLVVDKLCEGLANIRDMYQIRADSQPVSNDVDDAVELFNITYALLAIGALEKFMSATWMSERRRAQCQVVIKCLNNLCDIMLNYYCADNRDYSQMFLQLTSCMFELKLDFESINLTSSEDQTPVTAPVATPTPMASISSITPTPSTLPTNLNQLMDSFATMMLSNNATNNKSNQADQAGQSENSASSNVNSSSSSSGAQLADIMSTMIGSIDAEKRKRIETAAFKVIGNLMDKMPKELVVESESFNPSTLLSTIMASMPANDTAPTAPTASTAPTTPAAPCEDKLD